VRQLASIDKWYEAAAGAVLLMVIVALPDGVVPGSVAAVRRLRSMLRRPQQEAMTVAPTPVVRGAVAPRKVAPKRLEIVDVTVTFGAVVALEHVNLRVEPGEVVGLIGPNGAGKTSVIDALSGFCRYEGSVHLDGTPLDHLPPYRRIRRGLGRTFQGIELWNELTVDENVLVSPAAAARRPDEVDALFSLMRLDGLRHRPASELSQGQRQLVSIARSLVAQPQVVLLDEPAAGLDSSESAWLAGRLREIRDAGITVLLVDHDMNLVLNLCDHIEVLDFGRVIASGPPAEIRGSSVVANAYLGTAQAAPQVSTG
jgi:ABC-type branched-subunit amino acid transport system ATPase component